MKLRQTQIQRPVLKERQNLIPDVLVHRHPPRQRAPELLHHPRSEHRVRLARHQRMVHVSQNLRRILPIAMQQHNNVEPLVHEVRVAQDLIPAVPLVHRVLENFDLRVRINLQIPQRQLKRLVLTRIVEYNNFLDVIPNHRRNPLENLRQRRRRVVGNNQNANAFPLRISEFRGRRRIFRGRIQATDPQLSYRPAKIPLDIFSQCAKNLA